MRIQKDFDEQRLKSASFARKQLVRKFSRLEKRADDIPAMKKSQWLSSRSPRTYWTAKTPRAPRVYKPRSSYCLTD